MLLKDFLPHPSVNQFVRLYRIVHFRFDRSVTVPIKAYAPRAEHCLAFYPLDTEDAEFATSKIKRQRFRSSLAGQQTEVINKQPGKDFLALQIVFQPTGLFQLLGIPSYELTNQYFDAELFFHSDIALVNEQLYHAENYDQMLFILHQFVCDLIAKQKKTAHRIDSVGNYILQHGTLASLNWLANEACLSSKQFERKFKERVGLNPKLFSRIVRFDKAFRLKNRQPELDWLTVAIECGYYDYQHLVKDYKEFTGSLPHAFHEIENKAPERKLGLSEAFYRYSIE